MCKQGSHILKKKKKTRCSHPFQIPTCAQTGHGVHSKGILLCRDVSKEDSKPQRGISKISIQEFFSNT